VGGLGAGTQGNLDFVRSASSLFTEGDARQMQLSPSASACGRTECHHAVKRLVARWLEDWCTVSASYGFPLRDWEGMGPWCMQLRRWLGTCGTMWWRCRCRGWASCH
jgi:hypothetical protein